MVDTHRHGPQAVQARLARLIANIAVSVAVAILQRGVRNLVTLPSHRIKRLTVPAGILLALGLVGCQHDTGVDDRVREVAKREGADPSVAVPLERANKEFYENRPTESLFAEIIKATKSPNEKTRSEAFTTLATLRGTDFHDRAIKEIDRMKTDTSSYVRDRYVWVSYLVEHPNWKQIESEALASGSPEAQRLAKTAEGYGPRQPKGSTYGKSK